MTSSAVDIVIDAKNALGEGPLWSVRRQGIYWVDILGRRVQFHSMQQGYMEWPMPKMPSAIAECADGKLIIALQDEVVKFDTETGKSVRITELDTDLPRNRSNDGKCDRFGNFWIGTMQHEPEQRCGRLWRIDPAGNKTQVLDGIGITNSPVWDTARKRFYLADSMLGEIYSFALTDDGMPHAKKVFASNGGADWSPDGSTIDTEGCLWNAQWDASRIVRYSPDGDILHVIELPVKRPTSCTFGGPELSTLFITTARSDGPDDALGGALLKIETPYRGVAADIFGG
jgi:sugar lactone lactonase YvrE